MMVSVSHQFAFICIGKCASKSIEQAIKPYYSIKYGHRFARHMSAYNYQAVKSFLDEAIPDNQIESFCLVREPIDWVFSWYRFRQRDELKDINHIGYKSSTAYLSFNEFVDGVLQNPKRKPFNIRNQRCHLEIDGYVGVDRVFDFNRMDLVQKYLSEKIGQQIELPVKNVSPKREFELDSSLEGELKDRFEEDISFYRKVSKLGVMENATSHQYLTENWCS